MSVALTAASVAAAANCYFWCFRGSCHRSSAEAEQLPAPEAFLCPLGGELMRDPVTAADGHTYERRSFNEWLHVRRKRSSPVTKEPLDSLQVTENVALRGAIEEFHLLREEMYRRRNQVNEEAAREAHEARERGEATVAEAQRDTRAAVQALEAKVGECERMQAHVKELEGRLEEVKVHANSREVELTKHCSENEEVVQMLRAALESKDSEVAATSKELEDSLSAALEAVKNHDVAIMRAQGALEERRAEAASLRGEDRVKLGPLDLDGLWENGTYAGQQKSRYEPKQAGVSVPTLVALVAEAVEVMQSEQDLAGKPSAPAALPGQLCSPPGSPSGSPGLPARPRRAWDSVFTTEAEEERSRPRQQQQPQQQAPARPPPERVLMRRERRSSSLVPLPRLSRPAVYGYGDAVASRLRRSRRTVPRASSQPTRT